MTLKLQKQDKNQSSDSKLADCWFKFASECAALTALIFVKKTNPRSASFSIRQRDCGDHY